MLRRHNPVLITAHCNMLHMGTAKGVSKYVNRFQKNALVSWTTLDGTVVVATIEQAYGNWQCDLRLEDGTIIKDADIRRLVCEIPSVVVPLASIPDLVSYETGKPLPAERLIGYGYTECIFADGERHLSRYQERYPLDGLLMLWEYAESSDGLLNEREQAIRKQMYDYAESRRSQPEQNTPSEHEHAEELALLEEHPF